MPGEISPERAWRDVFVALDERVIDIAVVPIGSAPARFHARRFYEEDFVVAMRRGHPCAEAPTLARYCATKHLIVSLSGDPHGFVDELVAEHGHARRVALTVPTL